MKNEDKRGNKEAAKGAAHKELEMRGVRDGRSRVFTVQWAAVQGGRGG